MKHLRIHVLQALRGAGKYGLGVEQILTAMRLGSHRDLATPDLDRVLRDLADDSLVTTFNSVLEEKRWRITALGESALQEAGV